MVVSYNKLWKLLIEKGMTNADLRMKTSLSMFTLAKMSKNENVSLDVILSICKVLVQDNDILSLSFNLIIVDDLSHV